MIAKQVAEKLLETKAVTLSVKEPYTWASGLKSPIYCDNRITLSYPKARRLIANGLKDLILKEFKDVEAIVGVATGGLPQAALVADLLNLPLAYVRPQAKAVDAVKEDGFEVLGVAAVFTYELQKATDNFKEVKLETLSNYSSLIEQAVSSGYVSEDDLETLKSWREDPEGYPPVK